MPALIEFTHQIHLEPDYRGTLSLGHPQPPASTIHVAEVAISTKQGDHAETYYLGWTFGEKQHWELWATSTMHGALFQVIARKPHLGESASVVSQLLVAWIWKCRPLPEMTLAGLRKPGILQVEHITQMIQERESYFRPLKKAAPLVTRNLGDLQHKRAPGDFGPPFMQRTLFAAWDQTNVQDGVLRKQN